MRDFPGDGVFSEYNRNLALLRLRILLLLFMVLLQNKHVPSLK